MEKINSELKDISLSSPHSKGVLSKEDLIKAVGLNQIKYVSVCFTTNNGATMMERVPARHFVEELLVSGGKKPDCIFWFSFSGLLSKLIVDPSSGYGDVKYLIDTNTIRVMSWIGEQHAICLGKFLGPDGVKLSLNSPRNFLISKLEEFQQKHGYQFYSASELEFTAFNKPTTEIKGTDNLDELLVSHKANYLNPGPLNKYSDILCEILDTLDYIGITPENCNGEANPGQFEINFKYDEILKNCDNHIYFKEIAKQAFIKRNLGCSFMAFPISNRFGNSCHVHISAYDKQGQNIFLPKSDDSKDNEFTIIHRNVEYRFSKMMKYFIGGILKHAKELMMIYAPTVNSYKRLNSKGVLPFRLGLWSYESRISIIRVVGSSNKDTRIEFRLPGSDVNPYLVYSALIASGIDGIENKTEVEMFENDQATFDKSEKCQRDLYDAIIDFENSEFAKSVFGENHFKLTVLAKEEWDAYQASITQFEINSYLEAI